MSISLLKVPSLDGPTIRTFSDLSTMLDFLSDKNIPEKIQVQIFRGSIYFDIIGIGAFCIDDPLTAFQAIYLLSISFDVSIY